MSNLGLLEFVSLTQIKQYRKSLVGAIHFFSNAGLNTSGASRKYGYIITPVKGGGSSIEYDVMIDIHHVK